MQLNTAKSSGLWFVQTSDDPLGALVSIRPGMAAPMTYFRNNVQHLITVPALLACCFVSKSKRSHQQLHRLVQYAFGFLQNELYLPPQPTETALNDALDALIDCGLISRVDDRENNTQFRRASGGSIETVTLMRLSEAVMPALERYFLAAALLVQSGESGLSLTTLATRCQACAERLALTHGRDVSDLYDKHLHKVLIQTLSETRYVEVDDGHITATAEFLVLADETRTLVSEQMRHAIVHAASHFS